MPWELASMSYDVLNIINCTSTFHGLRQLKWGAAWLFCLWCHWCWHQYNMIPVVSPVVPFHSLGQDNWNKVEYHVFGHWQHWHWCGYHMMPAVLSMEPLHSLGQDIWNEVYYDLGHVTPLVLASTLCDANTIISVIIAFLWWRWSKWGATWLSGQVTNNVVYMLTPH